MNDTPMAREHELSKDCWCNPVVESYTETHKHGVKRVLFEKLAAIEHERWADWQKYMHTKVGEKHVEDICKCRNGDLVIPKELADQWERQMNTSYAELSEKEKESDRDQVRRYWDLIQ